MSRQIVKSFRLALLALLAMAPLRAQLDTRLAMTTDSMDVYKNPTTVKPEILTLIDMSGSTSAVTWHPNFKPSTDYSDGASNLQSSDGTVTVTLHNASGDTTFTVQYDGKTYTGVTLNLTVPVVGNSGYRNTSGSYIMPDGTPVETWLSQAVQSAEFYDSATKTLRIDGSNDTSPFRDFGKNGITGYDWFGRPIYGFVPSSDATWPLLPNHRYFALKATHGRMTYNNKTVDIPIPWRIFDSPPITATSANASTSDAEDPQSTAIPKARVQFDTVDGRTGASGGIYAGNPGVLMYNDAYFEWIFTGNNIASATGSGAKTAWANGLPALTRLQAMKRALLQTWLSVQTQVFWAIRAIDDDYDNSNLESNPTGSARQVPRILKDRTSPAIAWLQGETSSGTTPLTYATAGTYAQMVDGSVFADARKNETALNVCRKQFVIIFTDGLANDKKPSPTKSDPFLNSTVTTTTDAAGDSHNAYSGVTKAKGQLSSTYFNMWSLAGVAALGNDQGWNAAKTSGSGSIGDFAPFSVVSRDGKADFKPHHPIETMTIGVSLVGDAGLAGTSKNALLLTAGYGKAGQTEFDSSKYIPMNASAGTSGTRVRFWDAQNASSLSASIISAIKATMEAPPTTSSPVAPLSGMKAGEQVYFARYKAEQNDAPLWSGDLMMVRTQTVGTAVTLRGKDHADLTSSEITASNAIWAASNVLAGTTWSARKVFTYLDTKSNTSASDNRYASLNQSLTDSACAFSTSNDALLKYMTGKTSPTTAEKDAQKPKIEWMLGKGRSDGASILGDIINSTPVVVEYEASADNLSSAGLTVPSGATETHLRLIFVGTNHGMLHAFAEASYKTTVGSVTGVLQASAKEVWAFMPKEFAKGAYEQLTSGSAHVYMVDGPAAGYLDESGSTSGYQGKVDASTDKALVIFGLGKGGRSIYALDVSSPFSPKLAWALRPDDETDSNANVAIGSMGMSTGAPDQARVRTSVSASGSTTYGYKDLLFIGGGLSTDTIDGKFGTKLGRSVLAIDTRTGAPYQTWDFVNNSAGMSLDLSSTMGSVAAGPMAMEVLSGTNLTQRVYFSDRFGGVYALGCGKRQAAAGKNPGFRIDSSDPKAWVNDSGKLSVRKLFQANSGEYITTSPVPFKLPYGYPGAAISGMNGPQAVGVAVGMGDLWDPMDRDAANPAEIKAKEYNRLAVLFDRNDSAAKGYDSDGITITDLTAPTTGQIDPSASGYYLKSSDGYFMGFDRKAKPSGQAASETAGGVSNYYYHKIVSEPLVFRGVLYFTLLKPDIALEDGSCSGVSKSVVYRVADVINPSWKTTTVSGSDSGALFTFAGIPGKLSVLSPSMVGVAGTMTVDKSGNAVNNGKGYITVGTDTKELSGPSVRMKSWRIVR